MISDEQYRRIKDRYLQECVFCRPSPELLIAGTESFRVSLDVAPITEGHVIISSADHHPSGGELPQELYAELEVVHAVTRRLVEELYGPAIMYEHGRAGHCISDGPQHRLCHHFHLHCLPADVDLNQELGQSMHGMKVNHLGQLSEFYERFGDYLLFEDTDGNMTLYPAQGEIQRHLLRSMIAKELGVPELADWRADRSAESLRAGIARFSGGVLARKIDHHIARAEGLVSTEAGALA